MAINFCRNVGTVTTRRSDLLQAMLASTTIQRNELAYVADWYQGALNRAWRERDATRRGRDVVERERDTAERERDAAEANGRALQERLEEAQREWRMRMCC